MCPVAVLRLQERERLCVIVSMSRNLSLPEEFRESWEHRDIRSDKRRSMGELGAVDVVARRRRQYRPQPHREGVARRLQQVLFVHTRCPAIVATHPHVSVIKVHLHTQHNPKPFSASLRHLQQFLNMNLRCKQNKPRCHLP